MKIHILWLLIVIGVTCQANVVPQRNYRDSLRNLGPYNNSEHIRRNSNAHSTETGIGRSYMNNNNSLLRSEGLDSSSEAFAFVHADSNINSAKYGGRDAEVSASAEIHLGDTNSDGKNFRSTAKVKAHAEVKYEGKNPLHVKLSTKAKNEKNKIHEETQASTVVSDNIAYTDEGINRDMKGFGNLFSSSIPGSLGTYNNYFLYPYTGIMEGGIGKNNAPIKVGMSHPAYNFIPQNLQYNEPWTGRLLSDNSVTVQHTKPMATGFTYGSIVAPNQGNVLSQGYHYYGFHDGSNINNHQPSNSQLKTSQVSKMPKLSFWQQFYTNQASPHNQLKEGNKLVEEVGLSHGGGIQTLDLKKDDKIKYGPSDVQFNGFHFGGVTHNGGGAFNSFYVSNNNVGPPISGANDRNPAIELTESRFAQRVPAAGYQYQPQPRWRYG